jgi:hypothetical protein
MNTIADNGAMRLIHIRGVINTTTSVVRIWDAERNLLSPELVQDTATAHVPGWTDHVSGANDAQVLADVTSRIVA